MNLSKEQTIISVSDFLGMGVGLKFFRDWRAMSRIKAGEDHEEVRQDIAQKMKDWRTSILIAGLAIGFLGYFARDVIDWLGILFMYSGIGLLASQILKKDNDPIHEPGYFERFKPNDDAEEP